MYVIGNYSGISSDVHYATESAIIGYCIRRQASQTMKRRLTKVATVRPVHRQEGKRIQLADRMLK